MIRRIAVAILAAAVLGCGDDDGPTGVILSREALRGIYDMQVFTFDPQGSLPEIDLRARLSASVIPQLIVAQDSFQLVYRDPESGLVRTSTGSYTPTRTGLRLNFPTLAEAQAVLLPQNPEFVFDDEALTLLYDQSITVPLARFRTLAPEYDDEPLANPVPGRLRLQFGESAPA